MQEMRNDGLALKQSVMGRTFNPNDPNQVLPIKLLVSFVIKIHLYPQGIEPVSSHFPSTSVQWICLGILRCLSCKSLSNIDTF